MRFVVIGLLLVGAAWTVALVLGLSLWLPVLVTLVVALAYVARRAWQRHREARAGRRVAMALASEPVEPRTRDRAGEHAARELGEELARAVAALKRSKLSRAHGGALYALPWYLVIGPPGAGKSTALEAAGRRLAVDEGGVGEREMGGTRRCDWWLTHEAVLLDTAGRYMVDDEAHEEWLVLLGLLRRVRARQPLNGVVVALSVPQLLAADEPERARMAERLRRRLDEIMAHLELVLPVYVMLTMCDRIPGFVECFAHLDRSERDQLLGFTLTTGDQDDLAARLELRWTRLAQVLERMSVARVSEAHGVEARHRVYAFSQEVELLGPRLAPLLEAAFSKHVYREAPLLRGVYLASGTQVTPFTSASSREEADAGDDHAPSAPVAKSYFLRGLFQSVMAADRTLATYNAAATRRRAWVRRAVALGITGTALVVALLGARAYEINRALVTAIDEEIAVARGATLSHSSETLAKIEPLRRRLAQLSGPARIEPPWHERLGLHQGDALLPSVRTHYAAAVRQVLIAPTVTRLSAAIERVTALQGGIEQAPSAREHASLYELTRAYLLLTSPSDAREPALDDALLHGLGGQLVALWDEASASPSHTDRDAVERHVTAYLMLMRDDPRLRFPRTEPIVRAAREQLARIPAAKLAIDRLVADIEPLGWEATLEKLLGASGAPLRATGRVRGAFTRQGWEQRVRDALPTLPAQLGDESWVLGDAGRGAGADPPPCALRTEYFSRYVEEWSRFLGTVRIDTPGDHARALAVLQDLTRGQPTVLERLGRSIAHHAQIEPRAIEPDAASVAAAHADSLLDMLPGRAKALAKPVAALALPRDQCASTPYASERAVRQALEGFYAFAAPTTPQPEGAAPPATAAQVYHEQLTYVRDALQAYLDDPGSADALLARLANARTRVRALIDTQEVGWRPRFYALLWPPIQGATASSTVALGREKGAQWCTSVVMPFVRTLQGRYPFSKTGQDASLADVADFYRPESGILWGFYDGSLSRVVEQAGSRFTLAPRSDAHAMYKPALTRFLERSHALTTSLFPPRAEQMRVDFEVRVRPSPGIAQVLVDIDGQHADFHNGPERWVRFSWPGAGEQRGASLRVRGAEVNEVLQQEGEWGLFRLLEQSTVSAAPGDRAFTARWRLRTQSDVLLDVRPARTESPFVGAHGYLEAFRGAGVLAPHSIASRVRCAP